MTAITPVEITSDFGLLRNVSAQATTGQIDWIRRPAAAKYMIVYFNLSANAGTTPQSTLSIVALADPLTLDDASQVGAITLSSGSGITAASQHIYQVGPGVSGIANAGDQAAADGWQSFNLVLPMVFGIQIVNDRTTGDETYTYKLAVEFLRDR